MSLGYIESYLFFNGQARDAAEFYSKIFGVKPAIMTMKELPGAEGHNPDLIGYADLHFDENTLIRLSDNPLREVKVGDNISMIWRTSDGTDFDRVWKAFLDNGAKVQMPFSSTFFATKYGSVIDPFGISWMLMCTPEQMNPM